VAALTRTLEAAAFSAYNPKVELAAPGGSIAPLLPFRPDTGISLQPYQTGTLPGLRSMSVVHSRSGRLVGSLSFTRAALGAGVSYPNTTLTAPLVDCGFGNGTSPCPNAAGAVCLIQRGNNTFCAKSLHCAVGGGLGVLFYNRDTPDVGPCDIAAPVYTLQTKCSQLGSGIIPSLSIGRQEGEALKAAMQGQQLLVTMDFRDPTLGVPVGYTSGTSMATPHVSGVAGVVWAAAPRNCSAAGLRSVLQQTALDLGVPGRDNDTGYGLVQAAAAVQAVERHGCGHGQQQAAGSSSKPGAGATGSGSKRPPPSPPKQPSLSGQTAAAGAGAAGPAGPSPPKQQQGPAGQPNGGAATPALPGSSYIPLPRSMSARSL
jgi:subtilisin family serine protease